MTVSEQARAVEILTAQAVTLTPTQQSNADAMADAETLRQFIPETLDNHTLHSAYAVRGLDSRYPEFLAVGRAVDAARDAFRIVPGLRGEDTSSIVSAEGMARLARYAAVRMAEYQGQCGEAARRLTRNGLLDWPRYNEECQRIWDSLGGRS